MEDNQQMEEMGFEAFEQAFSDTDGYQTAADDDHTGDDAEETGGNDGGEGSETGDADAGDSDQEEAPPQDQAPGEKPGGEAETFTLRVNKEDRTVSREEVISLAQKGYDYDRVKGQLAESRQANQQLQEQVDKYSPIMAELEMVHQETGTPVEQLIDQLHVTYRMKNGESEAEARANIRALKAEKQIGAMKEKETKQPPAEDSMERARREVADFNERFPGVELTEELCKELNDDVKNGASISDAYQKLIDRRKDAEIADLKRQLEAEKQNKRNRNASPGSQNDSGGRRTKSAEDDFFAAFEK